MSSTNSATTTTVAAKRPSENPGLDHGESKKAAVVTENGSSPAASEAAPSLSTHGLVVNLVVENADTFVDFVSRAAGFEEKFRFAGNNGKVMHLMLDAGGVAVYAEELGGQMDAGHVKVPHVRLHVNSAKPLYVAEKLMKAGAKELTKCQKQSWGAMYGQYLDPFGMIWSVSDSSKTIEKVPEDMENRIIPFVSVRDAAHYVIFLTDVFEAETLAPPAKDPTGKIMCAELKVNGCRVMIGDHCGSDAGKQEPSVSIAHEVGKGKAAPLAKAFEANGGSIVEAPCMQFWGQVWGRCKDPFGQAWGLCEVKTGPDVSNEDMEVDMKIGAKYDWKYTWVMEDMPAMHCFGEVRTCLANPSAIAAEMKEMLPAAVAEAGKASLRSTGPPVSAFMRWEQSEGGKATFTSGPTVADASPVPEGDGLGARTVLGCKCVTVVHAGPYDAMMPTYAATFEWIAAKGYESKVPVVEIYENDPKEVEPGKLRTKICVPIFRKENAKDSAAAK